MAIIPRNRPSRRVVEKLDLRLEGIAERYLQINGVWEDHCRYAITVEEWQHRRATLLWDWVDRRARTSPGRRRRSGFGPDHRGGVPEERLDVALVVIRGSGVADAGA